MSGLSARDNVAISSSISASTASTACGTQREGRRISRSAMVVGSSTMVVGGRGAMNALFRRDNCAPVSVVLGVCAGSDVGLPFFGLVLPFARAGFLIVFSDTGSFATLLLP